MNSRFVLDKVSLPSVMPNIQQKVTNIINESNNNLKSLTGDRPSDIMHRFSISKLLNHKLNTFFIHNQREFKLLDLCHQRLSTIIQNPIVEKKVRASIQMNNKPIKKTLISNKDFTCKHQQNRTLAAATDHYHMRSQIDSKCNDLYSTCVDLSSTIRHMPRASLELVDANQSEEKELNNILQFKSRNRISRNRLLNHEKILRKTSIITKMSNELAFDAKDILSEVFLSNTKEIDYSQAEIRSRNAIKRKSMIKKAYKLIRLSENGSWKILNSKM